MTIDAEAFKAALRRWPSGVTVITMLGPERPHGMTASAFTSVSVDPPLILVVVDQRWRSHDLIARGGAFCVNVLAESQSDWSNRFAGLEPEIEDRFAGIDTGRAETGAPYLVQARAWLDCRVEAAHEAGDHTIFVGRVVASGLGADASGPLLYHDRAYGRLAEGGPG